MTSFYVWDRPVAGRGGYVGRETIVRSLVDGLHAKRSYLVIGGPRTGRSSTLAHVIGLVHERWQRQPRASKVVPVPMSTIDVPTRAGSWPGWPLTDMRPA